MWVAVIFFDRQFLTLFGAEETLLPLAREYMYPIKFVVPSFLFTQFMSAFLRNDGDPALVTKAVLAGGIFNVFGDYFFVFTLDWGIMGAGVATSIGSVFSLIIMLTHFFKKKNTMHLEKPTQLLVKLRAISTTGFSTFFIDVAMGILTMIFNRQCSEHCHRYYPQIWHFIHFTAIQHFRYLLFPGNDEAFYRFCCVRGKRYGSEVILFSPFIRRFRVSLNAYRDFLSTVVYAIHELRWSFSDNTLKEPDALGSFFLS